ncbi:MAG: PilN domain-containing protein [Verrucomicrobiota bacterium]
MSDELDLALEEPTPEEMAPLHPEVLVVPGHLFFTETIPLPEEIEGDEISEFVELNLESTAPFPIEQLAWGYAHLNGSGRILIYAAQKDRLKQHGYSEIDGYTWVLPDFATVLGAKFPEDTALLLKTDDCLSLLHLAKDSAQPLGIASRPVAQKSSEEKVIRTLQTLLPEAPDHIEPLAIRPSKIEIGEKDATTFSFTTAEDEFSVYDIGQWEQTSPSKAALWQADIRSGAFKEAERKNRKLSAILGRVAGWAAIAVLLLLIIEIVLLGGRAWVSSKQSLADTQAPTVQRIENQRSLIEKLDQVATNEMRPIDMLDAMNQVRPSGIYFNSTTTDALNQITIDGIASTVSDFNRYIAKLDRSKNFQLVGDPKSVTRRGETTFTVTFAYKKSSQSEPETAESSTPEEEAEI